MSRAPALPFPKDSADAQIDAAVLPLVDLLGRQTARELTAGAPTIKESSDAAETPRKD